MKIQPISLVIAVLAVSFLSNFAIADSDTLTFTIQKNATIGLEPGVTLSGDFIHIYTLRLGAFFGDSQGIYVLANPSSRSSDLISTYYSGYVFRPRQDGYWAVSTGSNFVAIGETFNTATVSSLGSSYRYQNYPETFGEIMFIDTVRATQGSLGNDAFIIAVAENPDREGATIARTETCCNPYWTILYDQNLRQFVSSLGNSQVGSTPFGYEIRSEGNADPIYGAISSHYAGVSFANKPVGFVSPRGSVATSFSQERVVINYATSAPSATPTPTPSPTPNPSCKTIPNEIAYLLPMVVGDSIVYPDGKKVVLSDITGIGTGTGSSIRATFQVYDSEGTLSDQFTVYEQETYSKNGVVVYTCNVVGGALGSTNYAEARFGTSATITPSPTPAPNPVCKVDNEFAYQAKMKVGEAQPFNKGKIVLSDITEIGTGTQAQTRATFQIYDTNGNFIDQTTLYPKEKYDKNGLEIAACDVAGRRFGRNHYASVKFGYSEQEPPGIGDQNRVEIQPGWNLISFSEYASIAAKSGSCISPTGFSYNTKTKAYDANALEENTAVKPGVGYWVKSKSECSIFFAPRQETTSGLTSLSLDKGWNLIGWGSRADFSSIKGDCKATSGPWAYDTQSNSYEKSSVFENGRGYWLKTISACILGENDNPPGMPGEDTAPAPIYSNDGAADTSGITITFSKDYYSIGDVVEYKISNVGSAPVGYKSCNGNFVELHAPSGERLYQVNPKLADPCVDKTLAPGQTIGDGFSLNYFDLEGNIHVIRAGGPYTVEFAGRSKAFKIV